jgi:adenine-specific DNA-methyltransferase
MGNTIMDNRNLLEKLTNSFNRNDPTLFFQAGGKFKPGKEDYGHFLERKSFVRDLVKLGKIDFEDGRWLVVLAGKVDKELTTHSGKLQQYEIAKKVLKDGYVDAGIFIFHDDEGHFRFSLITALYGAKKEYSNFRRYTNFVSSESPARTFITQIGKADFSSIEKITDAFSVEPVTTEFFRSIISIIWGNCPPSV